MHSIKLTAAAGVLLLMLSCSKSGTTTGNGGVPGTNPLPVLNSIAPNTAVAGGSSFTLTVNGSGFVNGSTINWNGASYTTVFISAAQLTASIPAAGIVLAGTVPVTVFTPTPGGGTVSLPRTWRTRGRPAWRCCSSAWARTFSCR